MPSPSDAEPDGPRAAPTLRDGRYALVGSLGRGSQAETLDAVDKRDGRAVAIKRFNVQHAQNWKDVELAQREANVLSALTHPRLPRYIEHFEEDGSLYLVMEKIEGHNLAKRKLGFDQAQVLRFLRDASECLTYLHGRAPPIIHRDIKPGNVIQRPDGSFCLVDFGSVRDRLKPEGGSTVVGTFGFMAPEQFQGRALPATDVYAVGATALTLLTGTEPQDLPHKGLAIDVKAALQGHVDRRLVDALERMLEPDPEKRAASVQTALVAAGVGEAAPAEQTRRKSHSPRTDGERSTSSRSATWYEDVIAEATASYVDEHVQRAMRDVARKVNRAHDHAERHVAHRQRKHERHAEKRARKEAKRAAKNAQRSLSGKRPRVPPGVILGLLLLIVFRTAMIATWALFGLVLPLLFRILSMFNPRLLHVADRMRQLAERGAHGLERAGEHIRYQFLGGPIPWTVTTSGEEVPMRDEEDASPNAERVRVRDVDSDVDGENDERVDPDGKTKRNNR